MKQIINNSFLKITGLGILLLGVVLIAGCEKFPLPETGSQTDATPPQAAFSSKSSSADYQTIEFANLSISATDYMWDFGDGNTSTSANPTNTYADGTYTVTLTATDKIGGTGTISQEVVVAPGPYQPFLLESGFEDNTLPDGTGDGRDSWRTSTYGNGSWAEIVGITGSPVTFGSQGGKLEVSSPRAGYQEFIVEANTVYDVNFWYTMKNDKADPWAIVSVVGVTQNAPIDSKQKALDATIASITVNNTDDPNTYIEEKLSFDSGDNTTVAIYFYNDANIEARFDEFSIDLGTPGAVPPSPGFDVAQSATDYLEYSFTDGSTDAVSWAWDFGDGNTSTDQNPTHVYATHDVYTVTQTVKNAANLSADLSKTIDIQAPVTAAFSSQVNAMNYQSYQFTDASEGAVMLLWEFGDGYQFTGMNPSHTYEADGTYTVTLTAYSVTGAMDIASETLAVTDGFVVEVNGGDFQNGSSNSDRSAPWDMTPSSSYGLSWNNTALNAYIDATYCTSEQPGISSDGAFENGAKSRAAKFSNPCRRLYQVVQVQQGTEFTFNIDSRSEAAGVNSEIFLLNTEISTEVGIDADKSAATNSEIDAYFEITNDFNSDKTMFTTNSFTFTPTSNQIVIYVRALGAIDSSNETWYDNVSITN